MKLIIVAADLTRDLSSIQWQHGQKVHDPPPEVHEAELNDCEAHQRERIRIELHQPARQDRCPQKHHKSVEGEACEWSGERDRNRPTRGVIAIRLVHGQSTELVHQDAWGIAEGLGDDGVTEFVNEDRDEDDEDPDQKILDSQVHGVVTEDRGTGPEPGRDPYRDAADREIQVVT
ncbi:unnamed protein product, partial [Durusdinium trenchii]